MHENITEWITLVATLIGFLVLIWVAVCVFCLMIFTIIMAADHIQVTRRSKSARHDKRKYNDITENQLFFERLREDEEADLAYTGPPTTGSIPLPQPKTIAERKAQEAHLAEQRFKLGYTTATAAQNAEMTMVYPAFDAEQTMVGQTPRYITPADGVQMVAGEEMLHPYKYPFNMEDNNDASRDRPA